MSGRMVVRACWLALTLRWSAAAVYLRTAAACKGPALF